MISITKFPINITEYAKLRKANVFPVKYGCKNCGYGGRLHRHGFYQRNAITIFATYRIFILRVKCPSCNKTYSVLPSFLIPYHQYTFEHIFLCLFYVYALRHSYLKIVSIFKDLNPNTMFSIANIYRFKKRMIRVAPIVNCFFANFVSLYFDMDKPTVSSIVSKIQFFIETKGDFNFTYSNKMPVYFFKKI
jgi:hypothetical protein